jgi:hypothetical protein
MNRMSPSGAQSVTSGPLQPSLLHRSKETEMSLLMTDGAVSETDALTDFVVHAQLMLDPATPEPVRRLAEPRLLGLLPTLRALGVFELFAIRDPALAALVRDELAARPG